MGNNRHFNQELYTQYNIQVLNQQVQVYKMRDDMIKSDYQLNPQEMKPLIVLHADREEGRVILETCLSFDIQPFDFAVINDTVWERDMTPWPAPPAFKRGQPFLGGANDYLKKLEMKILPQIIDILEVKPSYIGLAGYSLAGLFSLYTAYQSSVFERIVSASASLWYPEFIDFTENQTISAQIKSVYLSLGDQESHTRNPLLKTVEEKTLRLSKRLNAQDIQTIFERNSGGHFKDSERRLAKGIKWILSTPSH